jgi:hypothetical protein
MRYRDGRDECQGARHKFRAGFLRRVPYVSYLRLGASQGAAPMAHLTSTRPTKTVSVGQLQFNKSLAKLNGEEAFRYAAVQCDLAQRGDKALK